MTGAGKEIDDRDAERLLSGRWGRNLAPLLFSKHPGSVPLLLLGIHRQGSSRSKQVSVRSLPYAGSGGGGGISCDLGTGSGARAGPVARRHQGGDPQEEEAGAAEAARRRRRCCGGRRARLEVVRERTPCCVENQVTKEEVFLQPGRCDIRQFLVPRAVVSVVVNVVLLPLPALAGLRGGVVKNQDLTRQRGHANGARVCVFFLLSRQWVRGYKGTSRVVRDLPLCSTETLYPACLSIDDRELVLHA